MTIIEPSAPVDQSTPCTLPTSAHDEQQKDLSERCTRCGWVLSEHLALKTARIGIDVGGVLSKYPYVFREILRACAGSSRIEWHVVSDMHPKESILSMLALNDIHIPPERVLR